MVRGLSVGTVFRGTVDRHGRIVSTDESSGGGRAGGRLTELFAEPEAGNLHKLIDDREWQGVRLLAPIRLADDEPAAALISAVHRLLDVAVLPMPDPQRDLVPTVLRHVFDDLDEAVLVVDPDDDTLFTSARMTDLIGPGPAAAAAVGAVESLLQLPSVARFPFTDGAGRPLGTMLRAQEPESAASPAIRLVRLRLHDPLTGLPNRLYLLDQLRTLLDDAGGGVVAVLRAAVDGFEIINDTHGHRTGDQVLIEIADRLRELSGAGDRVARLGGDEFVVICPGLESIDDAHPVAERLLGAFTDPFVVASASLEVFASVGIASYRAGDSSVGSETLLDHANSAMHQAKNDSLAGGWAEYRG